jgi:hypothetical protein
MLSTVSVVVSNSTSRRKPILLLEAPSVTSRQRRLDKLDGWLHRRRATAIGELGWALLIALAALLEVSALVSAVARPDLIDFAAFRDNAAAWLNGTPYPSSSRDPNAPHVILGFLPFVYLPLTIGLAVWLSLSFACAALAIHQVLRGLAVQISGQSLVLGLCLLAIAPATLDIVANGNMVWPLSLLFTLAWRAAREGRCLRAGILLGVLMTAKPFIALWVPYAVLQRERGALIGIAIGGLAAISLGLAMAGTDAWLAWFSMLSRITWYDVRFNASIMGFTARAWHPDLALWLAGSVVVAATTARRIAKRPRDVDHDWLLLLLAALLISPLGWRYYCWLGVGPLVGWFLRSRPTRLQSVTILVWLFSPAPRYGPSTLLAWTVGSVSFWTLLAAWLVVGRCPPVIDESARARRLGPG